MEELFVRPRALMRMREGPLGGVHRYLHRLAGSQRAIAATRDAAPHGWLETSAAGWTDAASPPRQ
jgi:hypothetical protein